MLAVAAIVFVASALGATHFLFLALGASGCDDDPAPADSDTASDAADTQGEDSEVDIALDTSEDTPADTPDVPEEVVEEPYVAFYGTAGDFEGAYSFFDDTPTTPTLTWEMPPRGTIPANGLLVRFWFVLRDGRGGSDTIERALCIVP